MKRLFLYAYYFNSAFSLLTYLHSEHILFLTETDKRILMKYLNILNYYLKMCSQKSSLDNNLQNNLKIIYSLKNYICKAKLNLVLEENDLVNVRSKG